MPLTVGEVMSRRFQVLEPQTPCLTAWEFMRRTGAEHVAVVSHSGRIHGVLSLEDIAVAWCERSEPPFRETLGELLLARLRPRVRPDTPIGLAARIMLDSGFSALPVLDARRTLIGVVAEHDVLTAVAGPHAPAHAVAPRADRIRERAGARPSATPAVAPAVAGVAS